MNIPLFKIYWDENDINAVTDVIRSGKNWCVGPKIEEFEEKICNYLNSKYCVVFNSGGSALHALMLAYNFAPGDEIIIPAFTFIATAYTPLYVGAKPIFADVELDTFGLDPEDVKKKITKNTKAIIPIHYGGMPCKISELKKIAKDHDLILIEDAAESFGAKVKDKYVGTFGDSGMFSFCHNKVFTTSEGGCIITNNEEIYKKLKLIRSYGRVVKGDYFLNPENVDYIELGYNFRMSTILAALGISQLNTINKSIKMRRRNAKYFDKEFEEIKEIVIPKPFSKDNYLVYQMYTIRVLTGKQKRDNLMKYLKNKGISTKIYFDPIYRYSIFEKMDYENILLPNTEKLSSQCLTLPLYPQMKEEELRYIAESIKEFFKGEKV